MSGRTGTCAAGSGNTADAVVCASAGKAVNVSETMPPGDEARVENRFQMLMRVGIETGSSRRTAATHQSAGKSRAGRWRRSAARSKAMITISALPLTIAACSPVILRAPPPAP